jgi:hypothetical protein
MQEQKTEMCTNILAIAGMWAKVSEKHPIWEVGGKWFKILEYRHQAVLVSVPYLHEDKLNVHQDFIELIAHESEVFEKGTSL